MICYVLSFVNCLPGVEGEVTQLVGEHERSLNTLSENDFNELSTISPEELPDRVSKPIQDLSDTTRQVYELAKSQGLNTDGAGVNLEGAGAKLAEMGVDLGDSPDNPPRMVENELRIRVACNKYISKCPLYKA